MFSIRPNWCKCISSTRERGLDSGLEVLRDTWNREIAPLIGPSSAGNRARDLLSVPDKEAPLSSTDKNDFPPGRHSGFMIKLRLLHARVPVQTLFRLNIRMPVP